MEVWSPACSGAWDRAPRIRERIRLWAAWYKPKRNAASGRQAGRKTAPSGAVFRSLMWRENQASLRRTAMPRPNRPTPNTAMDAGSGTPGTDADAVQFA